MKGDKGARDTALEQSLITRLQELPIPIRLKRHEPETGGYWYQWRAMLAGTGDRGTFEDALIEALNYIQRHSSAEEPHRSLIASPGRHKLASTVTLLGALSNLHRLHRRVRATEAMYLLIGSNAGAEWLTGGQVLEIVNKQRNNAGQTYLEWEGYIEEGGGPDPTGIYLFLQDHAYRAFNLESDSRLSESATRVLVQMTQRLWMISKRDYSLDANETLHHHTNTIAMLSHPDEISPAAVLALMLDCLEIYEDNPRRNEV